MSETMFRTCDKITLYRRRAHLIVWNERWRVTEPGWELYWSQSLELTFARVAYDGGESLWLPLPSLIGHWSWLTGTIEGYRVVQGWDDDGVVRPLRLEVFDSLRDDPDTGKRYWQRWIPGDWYGKN